MRHSGVWRTFTKATATLTIFAMQTDQRIQERRRSHLIRRAMPKRVQITDNDIRDIFDPLARHAQLTTRQLVAFGARNPIITKARLGELWHATQDAPDHWLHRLNEDVRLANHLFVEDMHRLGLLAEVLLREREIIPCEEWVANSRIGGRSLAPSRVIRLAHDHMASNIALDIEIGARAAGAPFRHHIDLIRAAPEATRALKKPLKIPVTLEGRRTFVEPDAVFAIGDHCFALEADKGTESIAAVIVPKILAYREIVADHIIDDHLGVEKLTVLFATTSSARMKNVMSELRRVARDGRSIMFAFRAEPDFGDFLQTPAPTGRLFHDPWQRVGFDNIFLVDG